MPALPRERRGLSSADSACAPQRTPFAPNPTSSTSATRQPKAARHIRHARHLPVAAHTCAYRRARCACHRPEAEDNEVARGALRETTGDLTGATRLPRKCWGSCGIESDTLETLYIILCVHVAHTHTHTSATVGKPSAPIHYVYVHVPVHTSHGRRRHPRHSHCDRTPSIAASLAVGWPATRAMRLFGVTARLSSPCALQSAPDPPFRSPIDHYGFREFERWSRSGQSALDQQKPGPPQRRERIPLPGNLKRLVGNNGLST